MVAGYQDDLDSDDDYSTNQVNSQVAVAAPLSSSEDEDETMSKPSVHITHSDSDSDAVENKVQTKRTSSSVLKHDNSHSKLISGNIVTNSTNYVPSVTREKEVLSDSDKEDSSPQVLQDQDVSSDEGFVIKQDQDVSEEEEELGKRVMNIHKEEESHENTGDINEEETSKSSLQNQAGLDNWLDQFEKKVQHLLGGTLLGVH